MYKKLICVDKNNKKTGTDTWLSAHSTEPKLHRAFTALVFNSKGEVLLQKRSSQKPLWPDFWDGVSSHPVDGEKIISAGKRRLQEEMGFSTSLKKTNEFTYRAKYKNIGYEWEICAVLEGKYNGKVNINPEEASEYKWADAGFIKKDIAQNPEIYAPWFIKIITKKYD